MTTAFSKKFIKQVGDLVDTLGSKGKPGNPSSRVQKSALSTNVISPGDVMFFVYKSFNFGTDEHVIMVVSNKRGRSGVFQHKGKLYLSAVKLNNIWSFTANLLVDVYKDSTVEYSSKKDEASKLGETPTTKPKKEFNEEKRKKAFMALVGRKNYRTYIMNNIISPFKAGDKEY